MNDATFRIIDRGSYFVLQRRKYSWFRTHWCYVASGQREEVEREIQLAIKLPEYFDENGQPYDPAS